MLHAAAHHDRQAFFAGNRGGKSGVVLAGDADDDHSPAGFAGDHGSLHGFISASYLERHVHSPAVRCSPHFIAFVLVCHEHFRGSRVQGGL